MREFLSLTREFWDAATYIGDTETVLSRAVLVNQFQMLRRKIPILHLIILVNSLGLAIIHSFHAPLSLTASLPGAILAICIIQFIR